MKIEKNKKVIHFTKRKCGSGTVYDLHMRIRTEEANVASTTKEEKTKRIHELYCHTNMIQAKRAASKAGVNVDNVDNHIDCPNCKIGKARQKTIAKRDENRSERTGERLCIDC